MGEKYVAKKLEVGEKYLTIELDMGVLGKHKVGAFKYESDKENAPKWKGKSVSVWVNKKMKAKEEDNDDEDI